MQSDLYFSPQARVCLHIIVRPQSISNLLMCLLSLEELYLSENSLEDVDLELPPYTTLRLLQLTSNKISDWRHVEMIDKVFPNLQSLIVASNNITTCGKFLLACARRLHTRVHTIPT